jgi:hypothetical protein
MRDAPGDLPHLQRTAMDNFITFLTSISGPAGLIVLKRRLRRRSKIARFLCTALECE